MYFYSLLMTKPLDGQSRGVWFDNFTWCSSYRLEQWCFCCSASARRWRYLRFFFWYYALGCTQKKLPSANPEKANTLTNKLHLGHLENPNYLTAVLELERIQIRQAKQKAYDGVRAHLKHLQSSWLWYKRETSEGKHTAAMQLFSSDIRSKNIFQFIQSKHLTNSWYPPSTTNPPNL